jgi:hypothetical protein
LFIGILFGIYLTKDLKGGKNHGTTIINPNEIQVIESDRITSSEYLRITGKIKNKAPYNWNKVIVNATIFIGGKFSEEGNTEVDTLKVNDEKYFIIDCTRTLNQNVKDSLRYDLKITATK